MSDVTIKTAKAWQAEGAARYRAGDLPGALEALARAAEQEPGEPLYLLNLAELERVSGRPEAARQRLEQATAVTGPDVGRLNLLAAAWIDSGAHDRALEVATRAIAADGNDAASRKLFVEAVQAAPSLHARATLARAIREDWAPADSLSLAAIATLRAAWPSTLAALVADPLLAEVLVSFPVRDGALEQLLTALRRTLLTTPDAPAPLLARLATQCHLNEYAWAVSPSEAAAVAGLVARAGAGNISTVDILRLAAYTRLVDLPNAAALRAQSDPLLAPVLVQQISEPLAERAIAADFPIMTASVEGVSAQVQAQYEQNPYPRWLRMPQQPQAPVEVLLQAILPDVTITPIPKPEVLIAGCGTGQHALQAARYAGARILAVDLSRASLGYAVRKARAARVDNITFAQADLLDMRRLGRTFDVIESVGVVHHLADPFAGARALTAMLRPAGLMKLGLYSATARRSLEPAKALARQYPPTADGIRTLRAAILAAPAGDPVRAAMVAGDFFGLSSCRDLLMHVQEHTLTLDDIQRMLDENDLEFLGFTLTPRIRAAYRRRFPDDPAARHFVNWRAFEADNPTTFLGMYQFWTRRRT